MKSFHRLLQVAALGLCLVAFGFSPKAHAAGEQLILSTQTLGSAGYARAAAFAEVLKPVMPAGYSIEVQPNSTGGGAGGLLLEAKKAHIAIANNTLAKKLYEGTYAPSRPAVKNVAAMLGGTDYIYLTVMFTDGFVKKHGVTTFEEIIAKKLPVRVVTKQPGSFGISGAIDLLAAFGLTFDDIRKWGGEVYHIDPSQMTDMLREGKADLSIDMISLGQPAFTELTMTTPMHVIRLADATLGKMRERGYADRTTPAGTWGGQTQEVPTVAGCETLLIRKDVPDDVVYLMTKTICENKDTLARLVPAMSAFDPSIAYKPELVGLPLHPGAEKYFREVGSLR